MNSLLKYIVVVFILLLLMDYSLVIERFPDGKDGKEKETNPDDWGEGEILLPYDPKDRQRQREWPGRERRRREHERRQKERERRQKERENKRKEKERERRRKDHLNDPDHWGGGAGPVIL